MFLEHLTYGGKQKKNFKNQPRNRHAVWTGFKILVMLQESEINLPWQNNIKDKKHDASSTTGSDTINGVHHSFMPLPKKKKNYSHLAYSNFTCANFLQSEFLCFLLMTGINELKKSQSIFDISKNIQSKATQGNLFLFETYYYLTSRDTKETEDRKKSNPTQDIPTKISSMGFYAYVTKFWGR